MVEKKVSKQKENSDPGRTESKKQKNDLIGMKAICEYAQRSEPTVIKLVNERDFPAKKVGGIWESDRGRIDDWRRGLVG